MISFISRKNVGIHLIGGRLNALSFLFVFFAAVEVEVEMPGVGGGICISYGERNCCTGVWFLCRGKF